MTRRAWLLMGLLAALWGASYLFIKVALDDGMRPRSSSSSPAWRWAPPCSSRSRCASTALGIAAHAHRPRSTFMAIVQVVVPFLLITYGERHIASSLAGILVASAPIFTAVLAARFDADERPRGIAAAGVAMGIFGVVLLFGVDLSRRRAALAGGLMVLLAVARLRGRRAVSQAPPARRAGGRDRGVDARRRVGRARPRGALRAAGAMPSAKALGSLLLLGAGGTGIAFAIFYTLIAGVGPSRASLVAYIAPGFAVFYGVWLLSEPLTAGAVLGLVLILAGSWIAAEGRLPGRARACRGAMTTARTRHRRARALVSFDA